jgi:glycosyltransferase involved in cell wall biosynthesis
LGEDGEALSYGEPGPVCILVVPCYNEANRLQSSIFLEYARTNPKVHFLFVNDGSSDGTLALLQRMHEELPDGITVLDKQPNGGKAEAVRVGILQATGMGAPVYVGFWDADLATPLDAIPGFLHRLERDGTTIDMVFGARIRLLGRFVHRRPLRHYLGRVFASFASLALRLPIYDTQCGAKIFRVTPQLTAVLSEPFFSRWIFDVEILARFIALNNGSPAYLHDAIYELPLARWEDMAGSKVGPGSFLIAIADLWRIYWKYLR